MNKKILQIIEDKNLAIADFQQAVSETKNILGDIPAELGERILLTAAMSYEKDKKLCDVGGHVGAYLLILKRLGMDVTVIDFFPELEEDSYLHNIQSDHTSKKIKRFKEQGIHIINADVYDMNLEDESVDVMTSFECFEHFAHSPKPVMEQMVNALRKGGRLTISVPNIARIENRLRLLFGETALEKYAHFYHHGNPFIGHHREMTAKEVRWLIEENGLEITDFFTTDITVQSMKKRKAAKKWISKMNYEYGITDKIIPQNMRKHIWTSAIK